MLHESFPLRLVTEHVETRPLYSRLQEGIEQVGVMEPLKRE
jgi:hypothetical protein